MTKKTRYFMAGSAAILVAGLCTGVVAYFGGGFQSVSASTGPNELAYVPADATVIAYADVRSIMDSELRQRLKETVPMREHGQQEFQEHTGIDIEHDIDYIVAAMTTPTADRPSGLVVARGRFDNVRLEALAREHGGTVEEYRDKHLLNVVEHHTMPDGTQSASSPSMTMAFLEPGLVAVGESGTVKRAIDAYMGAQSIRSNAELMSLVSEIEQTNNAWAVGRFDVLANQTRLPEQVANQVSSMKTFAAAAHINGGVAGMLRAEARDDQAADNLRDIVRGLLALARMQAQSDPRVQTLAESLQLTGSGKTVQLSFTVPAELLQLMAPKAPGH